MAHPRSVTEESITSTRRPSAQLGMFRRTLQRILVQDLHMHPYKIQLVQQLNVADYILRLEYSRAFLNLVEAEQNFVNNFWMSDEAHFHLSGFVNKQNSRFWGTANPQSLHQKSLHTTRVTVWCAISANRIIGTYFFEDNDRRVTTVNSDRYRQMILNFFLPRLRDAQAMWF